MTAHRTLPIVGLTAGDPAGIGPELALRVLAQAETHDLCRPVIYGSRSALVRDLAWLDLEAELVDVTETGVPERTRPDRILVHDVDLPGDDPFEVGVISAIAGALAVRGVRAAVADALRGDIHAICTAPLNKESMWRAGHEYDGHTGLLTELCDGAQASMLLVGDRLRVAHVTTHVAFEDVPSRLSVERIHRVIGIAGEALRSLGIPEPRIAVAGLNPHAGEHGLFGGQEGTIIEPAIAAARADGWDVRGPISPDAVFIQMLEDRHDIVIAMYHDQGHIPVKIIEFDRAVNVSGGLPIVRTSVDHGTAFDIAGTGIARTENMEVALALAARMGANRAGLEG
jgi:4-hydroxythreonine-4-phosphate dehydrogenase